jgi:hypothetical protein
MVWHTEAVFDASRQPGCFSNFYADCIFLYYMICCLKAKRTVDKREEEGNRMKLN